MTAALPPTVSGSIMRLRSRCPFFAVLALHATWREREDIATAATDGEEIWFNKAFMEGLKPAHRDFVVAHEVGHVALRHLSRCGPRDPTRWNVAADIVVNGMLEGMGLSPAPGALRDPDLSHLRVEDVYARLKTLSAAAKRKMGAKEGAKLRDLVATSGQGTAMNNPALDAVWRSAIQRAAVLQRLHDRQHGTNSLGASLEVGELMSPQIDWRTLLWRFLVRTPTDYVGWDRRFIHQGQYLDSLAGESLTVAACVDTSGSVNPDMLRGFCSELQGSLTAYPRIRMNLFYADSELYGPWCLDAEATMPVPVGGGGTDLRLFFDAIGAEDVGSDAPDIAVYLTDGFGPIPEEPPEVPVLWLVPCGGLESFPWGEVARLEVT